MYIQFKVWAGHDAIFREDAFENQVGKELVTKNLGLGRLTKAEVIEDGEFALLTLDLDSDFKLVGFSREPHPYLRRSK